MTCFRSTLSAEDSPLTYSTIPIRVLSGKGFASLLPWRQRWLALLALCSKRWAAFGSPGQTWE